MNRIIDINDSSTYPSFLINSFINNYETDYNELFKDYYFKCCHVCCTSDINNYIKYGILRPYYVNDNGIRGINQKLKEIILEPLKGGYDYDTYSEKYDELLEKTYEKDKDIISDWYGKYSCVCYTLDSMNKVNRDNPGYEPIISCYGGEIFRDLGISDSEAEKLAVNYKSYAIFFKLPYNEITKKCIYFPNIIRHMNKIYNNEKSEYGFESNVNQDIDPKDFIEICEVK